MCIQSLQAGQKRCRTKLRPLRVREPLNLINMPHLFNLFIFFTLANVKDLTKAREETLKSIQRERKREK